MIASPASSHPAHPATAGPPPGPLGLKGPRAEVVMELKRAGTLTAKELARRVRLSLNAVRHHLKELEASGLLAYGRAHHGVGAPSYVYRLTPSGERLFPRQYEDALSRLLNHVVEAEGRDVAVGVLEAKYRELSAELRQTLGDASPGDRMTAVAQALAAEGYMPEIRPGAGNSGEHRLVEHNCPIQHVAERFPEVCDAEARFLAEVLEAQVIRDAHIASGCGTCEYQVRPIPLRARADVGEVRTLA